MIGQTVRARCPFPPEPGSTPWLIRLELDPASHPEVYSPNSDFSNIFRWDAGKECARVFQKPRRGGLFSSPGREAGGRKCPNVFLFFLSSPGGAIEQVQSPLRGLRKRFWVFGGHGFPGLAAGAREQACLRHAEQPASSFGGRSAAQECGTSLPGGCHGLLVKPCFSSRLHRLASNRWHPHHPHPVPLPSRAREH
jgi:hypothetical protein